MAPPGRPVRAAASGSCAHRSKAYSSARSRRTTPAAAVSEGEWTEERRRQQVRDTPIDPELARIRFDTLVGVRPRAGARTLDRVADWEIFLRLPLSQG